MIGPTATFYNPNVQSSQQTQEDTRYRDWLDSYQQHQQQQSFTFGHGNYSSFGNQDVYSNSYQQYNTSNGVTAEWDAPTTTVPLMSAMSQSTSTQRPGPSKPPPSKRKKPAPAKATTNSDSDDEGGGISVGMGGLGVDGGRSNSL